MRTLHATALGALAGLASFVGAPACGGDACESVGCGADRSIVSWYEGAVPEAASYELCVDDVCSTAAPSQANLSVDSVDSDGWQVGSEHGPADGDTAALRLVLRDDAGTEVAAYEGRGALSDGCCAAVVMQVDGDSLVPEP